MVQIITITLKHMLQCNWVDRVTNEAFRGRKRKKQTYCASINHDKGYIKIPSKANNIVERHFQNEKDRHCARELKKWRIVIAFPCYLPHVTTTTKRFLSNTKTAGVDHKNLFAVPIAKPSSTSSSSSCPPPPLPHTHTHTHTHTHAHTHQHLVPPVQYRLF